MNTVNRVIEITFVLIVVYLVIVNAIDFSIVVNTIGTLYIEAVKTLQGR